MPCKETLCSKCIHLQVCSYKKIFVAAQTEVENVDVTCQDDENITIVRISDITFLKPVELQCIYHMPTVQITRKYIDDESKNFFGVNTVTLDSK